MQQKKIWWVAATGVMLGFSVASLYLPGGDDLYRYYLPFAQGCLNCGYTPYFAQWFLSPLNLFPKYPLTWAAWAGVSMIGFMALAYFTKVNPFLLLASFPMLGQIWLGQIDVLICLGLTLFLYGKNPYLRGVGIVLALIKPQLSLLPIFFTLLLELRRDWLKLLALPSLVILSSSFVYGFGWYMVWINNAISNLPAHVWRLASIDAWRFGLFLLPLPFFVKSQKSRLLAGLLVSALATPFYGVYSYVVFLLFGVEGWALALSYAWILGFFAWGQGAMRFAWTLPLALLIQLLFKEFKAETYINNSK